MSTFFKRRVDSKINPRQVKPKSIPLRHRSNLLTTGLTLCKLLISPVLIIYVNLLFTLVPNRSLWSYILVSSKSPYMSSVNVSEDSYGFVNDSRVLRTESRYGDDG